MSRRAAAPAQRQRRRFIKLCGAVCSWAASGPWAYGEEDFKAYPSALLVDHNGQPIRASALQVGENYLFSYPFKGTPCFLLELGRPAGKNAVLSREDGSRYVWPGGVGPAGSIVAYSAICAHQLTHPTRAAAVIGYSSDPSFIAGRAGTIICCAHNSVYDPADGARVLSGPARQPLLSIGLQHDAETDHLRALGVYGGELFDEFFKAFKSELIEEYGPGKAREAIGAVTPVLPLTQYSAQRVSC